MGDAFSDADVAIGRPRPTVPERFEDYLRSVNATELPADARCEQCSAGDARWTLHRTNANPEGPYCARCLGYQHGYDLAEETVLRLVVAGVVAGALSAQIPLDSVGRAVSEALDEQRERQAFEAGRSYGRHVPRGTP